MLDSINTHGLSRTLKSVFPNLTGINFKSVSFDSNLNATNPLKYLTNDIDGDWYFGIGSMAMIFKAVSKSKRTKVLSDLLKSNGIAKSSSYTSELDKDRKFWKGNGFKVEMVSIEDQFVILITNENFMPDDTELKRGIHPLSDKINKLVKGLNSPIYNAGHGGSDGRFYATSEKANIIVSFSNNADKSIDKFNEIILEYNDQDKILKIKNSSIKKWLDENPEENMRFKVKNKFQIHLSKSNALYKIHLYPGGGLTSNWNFTKKTNIDEIPESTASQVIHIAEENFEINEVKEPVKKKEPKKISKKDAFLKKATITSKEKKVLNKESKLNKLKERFNFTNKNYDFTFLKRILKILLILLLIYFLFKACSDPCKNNAVCYYEKGLESEQKIEYDEAFKYYKKAIRVDRKYIDAYITRGNLYHKLKKHQKAIDDYTKVIAIDDSHWEAYSLRGSSYYELGTNKFSANYKKGLSDYDTSIEINDGNENAETFYKRGLLKEKIEVEPCIDYIESCNRNFDPGCVKYNQDCYPRTGESMYTKYFGDGVTGGKNRFIYDNTLGIEDRAIVLRNLNYKRGRSYIRIKSQFVRKGEILTMTGIPNGRFYFERLSGTDWINSLEGKGKKERIGGFLRNEGFVRYPKDWFYLSNGDTYTITVVTSGGNLTPEDIDEDEFMN